LKPKGTTVTVHDEQLEKALRKFKKKVANSGKLLDVKNREHYVKPTTERKLAKGRARSRWKKYLASQQLSSRLY
jgi:small subunit ribosomal protein S21